MGTRFWADEAAGAAVMPSKSRPESSRCVWSGFMGRGLMKTVWHSLPVSADHAGGWVQMYLLFSVKQVSVDAKLGRTGAKRCLGLILHHTGCSVMGTIMGGICKIRHSDWDITCKIRHSYRGEICKIRHSVG